jgi:membrane-associated protein
MLPNWLEPLVIIQTVGLLGVWGVIFAESGLFFGFFLPGDSLLFTAGFLASQGLLNIWILVAGCAMAAIVGDSVGYWFGRQVGPKIFSRDDSFFFNKKHLERTKTFYNHYGKKTIILARFVPIVRTFAPILAGVGEMSYATFLSYNIIGGLLWTLGLTFGGFLLGSLIPNAEKYLTLIILAIIIVSFIPAVIEVLRSRKYNNKQ